MNFDIARMYLSQSVNLINTRKRIISTNQMIGFYWAEGGTVCVLAWSRYSYFIFIDFIIFIFLFDCVGNRLEGFFNMTITTHDCCVMFMCKLVAYIAFLCWNGSEAKVLFRGNPDWNWVKIRFIRRITFSETAGTRDSAHVKGKEERLIKSRKAEKHLALPVFQKKTNCEVNTYVNVCQFELCENTLMSSRLGWRLHR